MQRDIRRSLVALGRRLWACTRDVLATKHTPCIRRSGAGFPFEKMEYSDPTSSILPSSNILVSLRDATSILKRASSLL